MINNAPNLVKLNWWALCLSVLQVRLSCAESEPEREYLAVLEQEARGETLTKQMVMVEENYYKLHKVCRYIDLRQR